MSATLSVAGGRAGDARPWPWWSVTKTAIAALALRLHRSGQIDLDEALPRRPYTLRQLLAHTAGLPCYTALPAYHEAVAQRLPAWSPEELIERAGGTAPEAEPGARWSYSNLGYLIARLQMEEVTGRRLADLLDREILRPAGVGRTRLTEGRLPLPHIPTAKGYDFRWVYHGCLIGPPEDAAAMMQSILQGKLLTDAERADLRVRWPLGGPIPGRPWDTAGYCMGLMSGDIKGIGRVEGHSGAGPFSTCAVYAARGRTVASFATSPAEAVPERAVARVLRFA